MTMNRQTFFSQTPKRMDVANEDQPRNISGALATPDEPADPSGLDSSGDVSSGEKVTPTAAAPKVVSNPAVSVQHGPAASRVSKP